MDAGRTVLLYYPHRGPYSLANTSISMETMSCSDQKKSFMSGAPFEAPG